jgi:hypothetical protein
MAPRAKYCALGPPGTEHPIWIGNCKVCGENCRPDLPQDAEFVSIDSPSPASNNDNDSVSLYRSSPKNGIKRFFPYSYFVLTSRTVVLEDSRKRIQAQAQVRTSNFHAMRTYAADSHIPANKTVSGQNIAAVNAKIRGVKQIQSLPNAGLSALSSRTSSLGSQISYRCLISLFSGQYWFSTKAAKLSGGFGDRTWGTAGQEANGECIISKQSIY